MCAIHKEGSDALGKRTWGYLPLHFIKDPFQLEIFLITEPEQPMQYFVCLLWLKNVMISKTTTLAYSKSAMHGITIAKYFSPARPEVQILSDMKYELFIAAYCNAQLQS